MRFSAQEQNPHTKADEQYHANELRTEHELQPTNELISAREILPQNDELQHPDASSAPTAKSTEKTDGVQKIKQLTSFLSTIAVVGTVATATIVTLANAPTMELQYEDIGFHTYECVLESDRELTEAEAIVDSAFGKWTYPLQKDADGNYTLSLEQLLPETNYELTVLDDHGKEHLSHTFITDPFVTIQASPETSDLALLLHESLIYDENVEEIVFDMGLMLLAEDGRDFSSNIYRTDDQQTFITQEGLFKDNYHIELQYYQPEADEPFIFRKQISLGEAPPPIYTITPLPPLDTGVTAIQLDLIAGDLAPYNIRELELMNIENGTSYYIHSDYIGAEGGRITAESTNAIPAGTYQITLWGELTTDSISLYNAVWQDKFTIE